MLVKRFAHYQQVTPALLELVNEHRECEQCSPKSASGTPNYDYSFGYD